MKKQPIGVALLAFYCISGCVFDSKKESQSDRNNFSVIYDSDNRKYIGNYSPLIVGSKWEYRYSHYYYSPHIGSERSNGIYSVQVIDSSGDSAHIRVVVDIEVKKIDLKNFEIVSSIKIDTSVTALVNMDNIETDHISILLGEYPDSTYNGRPKVVFPFIYGNRYIPAEELSMDIYFGKNVYVYRNSEYVPIYNYISNVGLEKLIVAPFHGQNAASQNEVVLIRYQK